MPCCLQNMKITSSSFTIGHIKQKCHCYPVFQICDPDENIALQIKGPVFPIYCFGNVDFEVILHDGPFQPWLVWTFKILTNDGTTIGKITKQWSGFEKEAFTDADNFGVTFPMDLDVKCKITLLAAVFLIVSKTDRSGTSDLLKKSIFVKNP